MVCKTNDDKVMKFVNTHLDEVRANRDYRVKWVDTHIGGRVVAKYLIDCFSCD